jgi:hypothetical protein
VRDPSALRGKRTFDTNYEREVFATIAAMVDAGKPPMTPRTPAKPKTGRQIRRAADPINALRKEVQSLYQRDLKPTLETLQRLLHADRSSYAPSSLSDYSVLLDRSLKRLLSLFTEKE